MKLREIAEKVKARPLAPEMFIDHDVSNFIASNSISELLNCLTSQTLLVTGLLSAQIMKVADLMDVRGICFTDNAVPDNGLIEAASKLGIALMETEWDVRTVGDILKDYLCDKGGLSR